MTRHCTQKISKRHMIIQKTKETREKRFEGFYSKKENDLIVDDEIEIVYILLFIC